MTRQQMQEKKLFDAVLTSLDNMIKYKNKVQLFDNLSQFGKINVG